MDGSACFGYVMPPGLSETTRGEANVRPSSFETWIMILESFEADAGSHAGSPA